MDKMLYEFALIYFLTFIILFFPLKIPKFSKQSWTLLGLTVLMFCFNFWLHGISPWSPEMFDRIAFPILTLGFYNYFLKFDKIPWPTILLGFIPHINQNLFAEGMLFTMPFWAPYSVIIAPWIWITQCRSVILAASAYISFKYFRKFSLIFIIPVVMFATIVKPHSTEDRWIKYTSALKMVSIHPFGWGLGEYEWQSMKYKPVDLANIDMTPHNDFLKILVEDGVPYFLFLFGFIALTVRRYHEIFFLFFIQAMFQFPLETPTGFIMLAGALGWSFAQSYRPIEKTFRARWMAIPVLLMASAFTFSRSAWQKYPDEACRLWPGNWRACLYRVSFKIDAGDYESARDMVKVELLRHPDNIVAQSLKAGYGF